MLHTPDITFLSNTKVPSCPASLTLHSEKYNLDILWECTLVAGHRQHKHVFRANTSDGEMIEVFWSKSK
jgi:hypothetical protein